MRILRTLGPLAFALLQVHASAQCATAATATPSITLTAQPGGTDNRSGLAFNPQFGLYYSVNAGSGNYPLDTYNADGTLAATVISGFDYRGVWWDPTTSHLLGNGYSAQGIFDQDLQVGTGLPLGTGSVVLASNQPDVQSIGDLDTDAGEIIYFSQGSIYRYSAATNLPLGSYPISGLPVASTDLNSNTVMYIGCQGKEIGVYDFVNRRVLYVDKATGAYSGSTQLSADAPQRQSFGLSYANGQVWLFELGVWHGYDLGITLGLAQQEPVTAMRLWPNPAADHIQLECTNVRGVTVLAITDMTGREVLHRVFRDAATTQRVDISGLPSGSYSVRVLNGPDRQAWPLVIAR